MAKYLKRFLHNLQEQLQKAWHGIWALGLRNPITFLAAIAMLTLLAYVTVRTAQSGSLVIRKPLWDWMDLLIVPIALAIGAYWLQKQLRDLEARRTQERQAERDRRAEERRLEEKQYLEEREAIRSIVAREQRLYDLLSTFYDQIASFLIQYSKPAPSEIDRRAVAVAQARTLNVLRQLDGEGDSAKRNELFAFLHATDLSGNPDFFTGLVLSDLELSEADLSGATLSKTQFERTKLIKFRMHTGRIESCSFCGAILAEAQLIDIDGAYVDFSNAKMGKAEFVQSDKNSFEHCIFEGAELHDAKLQGAFRNSSFRGAGLQKTTLAGDFAGVDFRDCDLSGANLYAATLNMARLSGITVDERTQFDEKWQVVVDILHGRLETLAHRDGELDLSNAFLEDADLNHMDLREVNFTGANLDKANLSYADLRDANLSGASLNGADLRFAKLRGTVIDLESKGADGNWIMVWRVVNEKLKPLSEDSSGLLDVDEDLDVLKDGADRGAAVSRRGSEPVPVASQLPAEANLSNADLSNVNLRGWKLDNVTFENSILVGAVLSGATLRSANFRNANLEGAQFEDVDLSGADFTGAKNVAAGQLEAADSSIDQRNRLGGGPPTSYLRGTILPNGQEYAPIRV